MLKSTVLFVGASGTSGRFIARTLANHSFKIKAIIRNPVPFSGDLPQELDWIQGDVLKPHTLSAAFQGCQGLYISLGFESHKGKRRSPYLEGFRNLLIMASLHRIQHIQAHFMWDSKQASTRWWGFDLQKEAVGMLRNQSIPYTLYFSSPFIENLDVRFRKEPKIKIPGRKPKNLHWASAKLVGELAAQAFFQPEFQQKQFAVQSPDIVTLKELAHRYLAASDLDSRWMVEEEPSSFPDWLKDWFRKDCPTSQWLNALQATEEKYESETTWKAFGIIPPTLTCMIQKAVEKPAVPVLTN